MPRLDNPQFPLEADIATALDAWTESDQRSRDTLVALQQELATDEEELEIRRRTAQRSAESAGVDEEMVRTVERHQMRKLDFARRFIDVRAGVRFADIVRDPPPPPPISRDFWWARTDSFHTSHFGSEFRSDGLVFTGGPNGTPSSNWLGDTDLIHAHFGAVAMFEITPARLPSSPSGRWFSEPFVDIVGGLLSRTTSGAFPSGDSWSKCWMHLDHQLFQWGFGPNGPEPIVLGQAHSTEHLVNEEDDERTITRSLPGFQLMPNIMFGGLNLTQSLWARLEVRFDVQVEGAGSLLWCDPVVRLVTHHWPLRVLS